YFPTANQEHVAITPENAAWFRTEVELGVTAVGPGGSAATPRLTAAPNPAAGPMQIHFTLPRPARVDLRLYDLRGREVARLATGAWPAGEHAAAWSGRDKAGEMAGAGVYFMRLEANGEVATRRFVMLR